MLYVAIWYVSIRPVVMRVKEELTPLHDCTDCTKLCNTVYYAVLLMMND